MLSLSTCNRVEILAVGKGNIVGLEIDAWARARGHSTSELAATHRIQAGIRTVQVTNRTYERAKKLATLFRGEAVPFDQMIERLANIDIVISSTESPEAIIRARDFRDVLKRRMMKQLDHPEASGNFLLLADCML